MRGDLEALYDAHAHRLYAHCWSLLGDEGAADAVRDAFAEAVRHRPQGETVLWLHGVSRSVCAKRGAFERQRRPLFTRAGDDPLMRAAAALPADHREALLLAAGEWLDVRDIARVFRISPGRVRELLHAARTGLERGVLEALMRGGGTASPYLDVIEAFEKGRLPHLLARRAPGLAPRGLREVILGDSTKVTQSPLVVIDPNTPDVPFDDGREGRDEARRRRWAAVRGAGAVAGVAASVAAGLMMTWPSPEGDGVNALAPTQDDRRPAPVPGTPSGTPGTEPGTTPGTRPDTTAVERGATDGTGTDARTPGTSEPSPTAPEQSATVPAPRAPQSSPAGGESGAPSGSVTSPAPSSTPGDASPGDQDDDRDGDGGRDRDRDRDDRRPRTGLDDLISGIVGAVTDPLAGGS
ncbi:hypothetical protein Acsp03_28480 [Actinomadura sp. NBRC 104412]|uniref:RNA polymerase sigma factor n=1 Tax=Actinomadura sp. NBRC 104412 TaxID=3032203 RepID=UPI0024A4E307|nr:sigma factor-like helix-turn-helix DNA-binding protein [Actinomadura sp. NBRC 104412]GLZ05382.1 hypothetical protein Acsp03_28480 [Actinomadura sp. NBRC 104412]